MPNRSQLSQVSQCLKDIFRIARGRQEATRLTTVSRVVRETGTISRHRLGGAGGGSESPITGDMQAKEGGG